MYIVRIDPLWHLIQLPAMAMQERKAGVQHSGLMESHHVYSQPIEHHKDGEVVTMGSMMKEIDGDMRKTKNMGCFPVKQLSNQGPLSIVNLHLELQARRPRSRNLGV